MNRHDLLHRWLRQRAVKPLMGLVRALGLAWMALLLGVSGPAFSQGNNPRQNGASPGPGSGAVSRPALEASASLKQQIESFSTGAIRFEAGVTGEIRRGVERLSRSCQAAPGSAPPSAALAQAKARIDAAQAAGQRALTDSASRLATVQRDTAAAIAQQCSGSVLGFFKSSPCQAADNLETAVTMLGAALNRYRDTFDERYRLYREVVDLESRECVRPGFTDRLLQANDSAMRAHEQSTPARLGQLLDTAGQLAGQLSR